MVKRPNHAAQAAVRAAAAVRRRQAEHARRLHELEALRVELEDLDVRRAAALARRDRAVAGLRAAGVAWDDIARLAGTTRQALMKRR